MLLASKQKYTAILLSLFIHLFILVILFFIILSQYHGTSIGDQLGKEISDTLFYEPLATQPEESAEERVDIDRDTEPLVAAAEEALSYTQEITQNHTANTTEPEEVSAAVVPALGIEKLLVQAPEAENIVLPTTARSSTKKIRRRKKRPHFSFAQLASGFKNYIQNQQNSSSTTSTHDWLDESLKENLKDGVYIDNKGIPHRASDTKKDPRYAHVDDELAKMAFFTYMKGVNSGLKTAFSLTKETVYFNEKREERYSLEITIIADGSVSEVRIIQAFEKREFDDYVIRTIKNYQFAPLPARLKTPHIIKRLDAIVHARAGTNRFELIINY